MGDAVLAAIIGGVFALVVLLLQHGVYEKKLASQREKHELDLENLRLKNLQELERFSRLCDEAASLRETRRLSLERLWSAISIASTAADAMVKNSSTNDIELLVERTAKFIQELSPLISEVKSATHNLSLYESDVKTATDVQNSAVKLFLSLDLDSGKNQEYRKRLEHYRSVLDLNAKNFKTIVEQARIPGQ